MNKTAKKVVATILTTVMTVGAATVVSADDLSITLSHQPYSHALPSYIGEEEGIFEENGLNTEILWFSSGNTQNEALGANGVGCRSLWNTAGNRSRNRLTTLRS